MLIKGDSEKAGKEATAALRLDKRNFGAVKLLTSALLQSKRYDDAIKLITDVRKKVPDDLDLLGDLGIAYIGKKDFDKAKATFRELLKLSPANSKALAFLTSLSAKNDIKQAISMVKAQINLAPKAVGHYMLLGELLLKDKQPEQALEALKKAQELAPQLSQPYMIRARIMHALGKTNEAVAEFKQLIKNQPDFVPANLGLATLYESQKDYAKAKSLYEKVLQLQPNQPVAANNLAYLTANDKNGDLGEALRLAMLAKQAEPNNPNIADTLGYIHYKRQAYDLAISQFQQALAEKPDDPAITYHLALAQFGNKEKKTSLATLEKALASKSPFAEREEAEKVLQKWKK